ncbi:MAG TPA: oligopeptide transporter, OPT family [Candidatus Saccharicenans sp.]|nr:oligopeptide transporter, OPT family [Candidatus Saccharicenans sp.]HOL45174.1 oligopeptide transporter, OPT family [Candidatus Saccharicenans sp.]HOM94123.1 oligopeptide transporter, OPT family [Candidatus Saccharicenans sp.]HOT68554.1 oligopeptide transporter, OPT family [Candidatus Saccharicenans sp.]HPC88196.1 oligopeptide transporter, OPT family [Candidatus Saccharicenans sp.]
MESRKETLPPEAYRPLAPGEKYRPLVPPEKIIPEVTTRSVLWGLVMALLFTFSMAYLGLKVGTVPEAAIPIAILAVGIGYTYSRKNTILENVIIQSIGAASGALVAGAIFTIPALFIIGLPIDIFKIFLSTFLGGCLGILFLIPLRRYFCVEQHGKLPFPEATATTEILVSSEGGKDQAKPLILGVVVASIYEFLAIGVRLWNEVITFRFIPFMDGLAEKTRMVLKIDALSAFLGLGYVIGFRYNAIIVAGGLLSHFAFIPVIWFLGQHFPQAVYPGTIPIGQMSEVQIFNTYVRNIGIGAIFMAGVISIIKSMPIMVRSFSLGFKEILKGKKGVEVTEIPRTDRDLKMSTIIIGIGATAVALFFYFLWISNLKFALIGVVICLLLSFLFTTVAANAIAIVGTNPVSGMTLITIILSSVILIGAGLSGQEGMAVALLIGAVVCTALSVSGSFITDLKIGYWIGATPRNQERFKFAGIFVSALTVGVAIFILDRAFSFQSGALAAPQANLMAAVIKSMMSREPVTWLLYGVGAAVAIVAELSALPPLPLALGMYLPLHLTTPLLVGGFLSHLVKKSTRDKELAERRHNRGTLISSGFIAGGALMGIVLAVLKLAKVDHYISLGIPMVLENGKWVDGQPAGWFAQYGEIISLAVFILLIAFVYREAKKEK